jgi:hypothetical protein
MKKLHLPLLLAGLALTQAPAHSQLLVNGGFETGTANIGAPPSTMGEWRGDGSAYVTAQLGITPFEGTKMLRLISAKYPSEYTVLIDSQYYQNIDLSAYAASIALGQATFSVSAMFNRVLGDAQTDTQFGLRIRARTGTGSAFADLGTSVNLLLASDGNPATWEPWAINDYVLPQGTDYVQLEVFATENVFNNTSSLEFDGHFVDAVNVNVNIVPEPGSLFFLAIGCVAAGRRWRAARCQS